MNRRDWEILGVFLFMVVVVPILAILKALQYCWWCVRGDPTPTAKESPDGS